MTMNRLLIRVTAFCAAAVLLAAVQIPANAQDSGPMKPRESTKFPTPLPPTAPERPPTPPEEIIRRFAAKEDEMARAIPGYSFQKSVQVEEIGRDNKPTGQLEIITRQTISRDGKLYEKPLSRPPATLHFLDIQRGDSDLLAATPLFPFTTAQLPKYEITYGGKQPLDESAQTKKQLFKQPDLLRDLDRTRRGDKIGFGFGGWLAVHGQEIARKSKSRLALHRLYRLYRSKFHMRNLENLKIPAHPRAVTRFRCLPFSPGSHHQAHPAFASR